MINSFNSNDKTEQVNIGVDQNKKNKTDGSNKTTLDVTQKRRLGNVASVWFGDDLVKFFQSDFKKQIKQIEDIELEETKEKLEIIKKEEVKKVEEKKAKKKKSIRSTFRKIRILMHIASFVSKLYDNFKKFKKETDSIISKHFKNQGFTLKDVLTDEPTRDLFVAELEEAINEIALSFYHTVLIDSISPTLEFVTKMALEKLLSVMDDLRDKIQEAEDVVEDKIESKLAKQRIKNFAKNMTGKNLGKFARLSKDAKILYTAGKLTYTVGKGLVATQVEAVGRKIATKTGQKIATKVAVMAGKTAAKAAVHAAIHAAALSSLATGPGVIVGAALEIGLLLYDAWDITTSFLEAQEMYDKAESELHRFGVRMIKMGEEIEKLSLDNEITSKVAILKAYNSVTPEMMREMQTRGISLTQLKIEKYLKIYERYNSDISNIINDFSKEDEFEPDEVIAIKERNLDFRQYRSYRFVIAKWAAFFKTFTEKFNVLFTEINSLIPKVEKNIDIEEKPFNEKQYNIKENKIIQYNKLNKKGMTDKMLTIKYLKARKLRVQKIRTIHFLAFLRNS